MSARISAASASASATPGHKDGVTGHVQGNYHKGEMDPLTDPPGAIAAEAKWLADGNDVRFQSDLAMRLQG